MKKFSITLQGTAPLLMHNARLSNPIDPATKALKDVTKKRIKTDDDHERIAELEFYGGLYIDPVAGPYLPADNIWRCLHDASKQSRQGPKVKSGVFISTDINPVVYKGPRTGSELWGDGNFHLVASAKVTTQRVMRCRPMFPTGWICEAEGVLDTDQLDLADLKKIADTAGFLVGIGDWRPRYGRFEAGIAEI